METKVNNVDFWKSLPIEVEIKNLADLKTKFRRFFVVPSKATFYQIIWVKSGEATFHIDFRPIHVKAGELFIISINQVCSFDITSDYEGKMILFTETFFSQTEIDSRFLHTSEILSPDNLNRTAQLDITRVEEIIKLLGEELARPFDNYQPHIAQSYLRALLFEAERMVAQHTSPVFRQINENIARRFCDEVEKHFKVHKQAEHYMQLMGVSEKILTKEVRLLTNKTPKKYLDSRIILEAKRLLTYSQNTVKEIAYELGFDEATNFNKFFRKHTGTTPILFRQDQQK